MKQPVSLKAFAQLIVTLYTIFITPSVHNAAVRTLFEIRAVVPKCRQQFKNVLQIINYLAA